jgi:hypothetical protein
VGCLKCKPSSTKINKQTHNQLIKIVDVGICMVTSASAPRSILMEGTYLTFSGLCELVHCM